MVDCREHEPRSVETLTVVRVVFLRGAGVRGDPCREVSRYYGTDGQLLAEYDPCRDTEVRQLRDPYTLSVAPAIAQEADE